MKTSQFWWLILLSFAVTPIMILLGISSAGAGHGDYILAKILFPYTMLSTSVFDSITSPFIAVVFLQFPIYGLILALGNLKGKILKTAIFLSAIHILFVLLCFFFIGGNF